MDNISPPTKEDGERAIADWLGLLQSSGADISAYIDAASNFYKGHTRDHGNDIKSAVGFIGSESLLEAQSEGKPLIWVEYQGPEEAREGVWKDHVSEVEQFDNWDIGTAFFSKITLDYESLNPFNGTDLDDEDLHCRDVDPVLPPTVATHSPHVEVLEHTTLYSKIRISIIRHVDTYLPFIFQATIFITRFRLEFAIYAAIGMAYMGFGLFRTIAIAILVYYLLRSMLFIPLIKQGVQMLEHRDLFGKEKRHVRWSVWERW
jgi:hypothetical protein